MTCSLRRVEDSPPAASAKGILGRLTPAGMCSWGAQAGKRTHASS
eukprot:CAMPEP_0184311442 /NCGR_PEP_ID=MMETSP1049-20130417/41902_1 /TAXON_ID=77928 /ORGANISM="Proteomonas sulcata, Strain CCMP704" /LENGTH=44 /DNA_ID= /DNA_START= /DNA_END= /DNA_ORIENTATION=